MKTSIPSAGHSFKNHFLLAMPGLNDPNFQHSLVFICEHTADGAMGFIINSPLDLTSRAIFEQLNLPFTEEAGNQPLFNGGPVQRERGFILHRGGNRKWESTLTVSEEIALTASRDILDDIANGQGPSDHLITLGYSGWGPGQLDYELMQNSWLTIPASSAIIFDVEIAKRASVAASSIGLDLGMLSSSAGHA